MKFWEIDTVEGPATLRQVREVLRAHPEIKGAHLSHWCRDDFVGSEFHGRDEVLSRPKRALEAGATAQWAWSHVR
jgi:hypothetical protein